VSPIEERKKMKKLKRKKKKPEISGLGKKSVLEFRSEIFRG